MKSHFPIMLFAVLTIVQVGLLSGCQCLTPDAPLNHLQIYWLPTSGSTLIKMPTGEVVLIDSGEPLLFKPQPPSVPSIPSGDAIYWALTNATGTNIIDDYITTHWHADHFYGIYDLRSRVQINRMWGRSPSSLFSTATTAPGASADYYWAYEATEKGRTSFVARLGTNIILNTNYPGCPISLQVIAANGETLNSSQPNTDCCNREDEKLPNRNPSPIENTNSLALLLKVGRFRYLEDGDLICRIAMQMLSANDPRLTPVDVYRTAHHADSNSNPECLLQLASPSVVVANNPAGANNSQSQDWWINRDSPPIFYQTYLMDPASHPGHIDTSAVLWPHQAAQSDRRYIKLDYTPGANFFEMQVGGADITKARVKRFKIKNKQIERAILK